MIIRETLCGSRYRMVCLWHIYHIYPSLGHAWNPLWAIVGNPLKHLPRIVYAHPRKNHTDDDHQRWSLHSKDGKLKKSYLPNPQVLNLGKNHWEVVDETREILFVDSWPNFKGYFKGGCGSFTDLMQDASMKNHEAWRGWRKEIGGLKNSVGVINS